MNWIEPKMDGLEPIWTNEARKKSKIEWSARINGAQIFIEHLGWSIHFNADAQFKARPV